MFSDEEDDQTIYVAVVNHEEQYSIWPEYKPLPLGWNATGKSGSKAECLSFIELVWTDMRPLSLQLQMKEMERKRLTGELEEENLDTSSWNEGPTLVERLTVGRQRVEVSLRPERTVALLKECIDRKYVHVKFTETHGGTELGFKLDDNACDFSSADLESGTGKIHLEGELTLDYERVTCIADIDLSALEGEGHLVRVLSEVP